MKPKLNDLTSYSIEEELNLHLVHMASKNAEEKSVFAPSTDHTKHGKGQCPELREADDVQSNLHLMLYSEEWYKNCFFDDCAKSR